MNHIDALNLALSHERTRLDDAKTDAERAMRSVWVAQLTREVAAEEKFLGIASEPALTDDELMAALQA